MRRDDERIEIIDVDLFLSCNGANSALTTPERDLNSMKLSGIKVSDF